MFLVLALLVVLLIAWVLGLGQVVHFNATLHVGGGLETLVVVVLVVVLLAMLLRGRPFRI